MIFYALTNLVLSGVSDIALITNRDDVLIFERLLQPLFENSNCKLSIIVQENLMELQKFLISFQKCVVIEI